jgi:hypothetical protein
MVDVVCLGTGFVTVTRADGVCGTKKFEVVGFCIATSAVTSGMWMLNCSIAYYRFFLNEGIYS